jgi:hypothetical protein
MVDVEIYMNNILKFFGNNPKDLKNLVPENKKEEFFSKIREVATNNYEKGEDVSLTNDQLIEICVVINGKKITDKKKKDIQKLESYFIETKFGLICLN